MGCSNKLNITTKGKIKPWRIIQICVRIQKLIWGLFSTEKGLQYLSWQNELIKGDKITKEWRTNSMRKAKATMI